MRADHHAPTLGSIAARWTVAALAVTAVVTAVSTPVSAAIEPSGQLCFSIAGNPGDAAVVNLTPVRATGNGNGQLISSDIKSDPPVASNVNFASGTRDPNVAIAAIGTDGQVCFQNSNQVTVDLVADHLGTITNTAYKPASSNGAPARLVDTRIGQGGSTLRPSGQLCFSIAGNPGDAAVVNLTPVRATGNGNGQLISSDIKSDPPVASNVNFASGTRDPNVAIAAIGTDGQVCFQNSNQVTVDLVADHLGTITNTAYKPASSNGAPARLVDTRIGQGGSTLRPSGQLCFSIAGNPGDAAVVNLTPVRATGNGNGQLISSDIKSDPPVASNVNFASGTRDPNVAIAAIGTDGQVCFQNSNQVTVDLVADHLGTITGSAYTLASTTRVLDTREDVADPVDPVDVPDECVIPRTTSYRTTTAQHMFGLSSRAYEIEPGDATLLDRLDTIGSATVHFPDEMNCWELVTVFRGGATGLGLLSDTEVIVARNVHTYDLAVSFRGSEANPLDILNDLSAIRVPWPLADGRTESQAVHSGFLVAYSAAKQQLSNVLRAHQRADVDGARVFFTGHSLGGALATLASMDLVDDLMGYGYERNEVVTYTFGAPRTMSERMSNLHRSIVPVTYAVAHPRDLVSHLPTPIDTFANPYSHVRNMVVLNAEKVSGIDLVLGRNVTVRRNAGDGRDYRACSAPMWVPDLILSYHARSQYSQWLDPDELAGRPTVSAQRINRPLVIDDLRMRWSTPVEGPCDQVALFERSSEPTSLSGAKRDVYVTNLLVGSFWDTFLNVDDANWIAYIDIFGKVISATEFDIDR